MRKPQLMTPAARAQLIATACDALQQALCKVYDLWCDQHGLPHVSADEQDYHGMQAGQVDWLTRFQDACSFYEHADGEARANLRTRPRNDLGQSSTHAALRTATACRTASPTLLASRSDIGPGRTGTSRTSSTSPTPARSSRAITLRNKPPVLAMSRASASGTEPTREAILPEFRARWEIVRRHRED